MSEVSTLRVSEKGMNQECYRMLTVLNFTLKKVYVFVQLETRYDLIFSEDFNFLICRKKSFDE